VEKMKNYHFQKSIDANLLTGLIVLVGTCFYEGKNLNETINYIQLNVFNKVTSIDFEKYYKNNIEFLYNNFATN
jgi:hypothetical protein